MARAAADGSTATTAAGDADEDVPPAGSFWRSELVGKTPEHHTDSKMDWYLIYWVGNSPERISEQAPVDCRLPSDPKFHWTKKQLTDHMPIPEMGKRQTGCKQHLSAQARELKRRAAAEACGVGRRREWESWTAPRVPRGGLPTDTDGKRRSPPRPSSHHGNSKAGSACMPDESAHLFPREWRSRRSRIPSPSFLLLLR